MMKHEVKQVKLRNRYAVMVHKDDLKEYLEFLELVKQLEPYFRGVHLINEDTGKFHGE